MGLLPQLTGNRPLPPVTAASSLSISILSASSSTSPFPSSVQGPELRAAQNTKTILDPCGYKLLRQLFLPPFSSRAPNAPQLSKHHNNLQTTKEPSTLLGKWLFHGKKTSWSVQFQWKVMGFRTHALHTLNGTASPSWLLPGHIKQSHNPEMFLSMFLSSVHLVLCPQMFLPLFFIKKYKDDSWIT